MLKGAMNKKAQEGLTLTTLLLIVLGVVVVVVIILGATGAFDFIFGKIEVLPGQSLESAVQSCKIAAENNLKTDFCVNLKNVELNGKEQYVTCNYLKKDYLGEVDEIDCGSLAPNVKEFCESKKLKAGKDLVNGELCPEQKSPTGGALGPPAP